MGAWGIGVFEDDTALDILDMFETIEPIEFISESLENAILTDYLEYDEGINVLVSAAFIDTIINKTKYEILNDEYEPIIEIIGELNLADFKIAAVKALNVVVSDHSEINELWSESEVYDDWKANIISMISRLK
jgi:hypothetical protein